MGATKKPDGGEEVKPLPAYLKRKAETWADELHMRIAAMYQWPPNVVWALPLTDALDYIDHREAYDAAFAMVVAGAVWGSDDVARIPVERTMRRMTTEERLGSEFVKERDTMNAKFVEKMKAVKSNGD